MTANKFFAVIAFWAVGLFPARLAVAEAPNFYIGEWVRLGDAIGEYHQATKIRADGKGSVFVLNSSGVPQVLRFSIGGRFLNSWHPEGRPLAMALDADGHVVLFRLGNIDRYDAFGNLLETWNLDPPPAWGTMFDIAVDAAGNVFVIESGSRISVYGPAGHRVASWDSGHLNVTGIALSSHDEVWLVGTVGWFEGAHVWQHDALGAPLRDWALAGTTAGTSIALAADGTLYVGALYEAGVRGAVFRYASTGARLAAWEAAAAFTELAVDLTGLVLVSHVNARITLYAPPPPAGIPILQSPAVPGFRFGVRIRPGSGAPTSGQQVSSCIPETICVSGAVPGRSEVFLRVVGPKPNGRLWPTLVKFSTSTVEIWAQQISTGALRYYTLYGAAPGDDSLAGLFDRSGFLP